ncbi:MAG: type ISP restriction/modification enzyme, partial [Candidatus Acidiferrales bacterium]
PAYLEENADGVRQDWPRIPLPNAKELLQKSAKLGRQIAVLLDPALPRMEAGESTAWHEYKVLATAARAGGGSLSENDFSLTAGWGHAGKGGVTMPGKGKLVERDYSVSERKAIIESAKSLGITEVQIFANLGNKTFDVYLNDAAYWSNVPEKVWDYTIGGYQVIKKWLSYREKPLLGRSLTKDEVRYVQEMARRIAAILLLQPSLDANYLAVKSNPYDWK